VCKSAGAVVDYLAYEYERAGKNVIFLEHNIDDPQGPRLDRWYDAYGGQPSFAVPLVMADSGYRVSGGYEDYQNKYRLMVDACLERPAGAELHAWYQRDGQNLEVTVTAVNRSGVEWTRENLATVNVIVYEDTHAQQTDRIVRAATARYTGTLAPNDEGTYHLSLTNVHLAGVLALVEYRPDPAKTPFEMLQAVIAVEGVPPTATPSPTPWPTVTPGGPPLSPAYLPYCWR